MVTSLLESFLFLGVLGEDLLVLSSGLAALFDTLLDLGSSTALALQTFRSDKTLDLGGDDTSSFLAFLKGVGTLDDVVTDVVFLAQVEQAADLGGTLGSETTGDRNVGKTFDFSIT